MGCGRKCLPQPCDHRRIYNLFAFACCTIVHKCGRIWTEHGIGEISLPITIGHTPIRAADSLQLQVTALKGKTFRSPITMQVCVLHRKLEAIPITTLIMAACWLPML